MFARRLSLFPPLNSHPTCILNILLKALSPPRQHLSNPTHPDSPRGGRMCLPLQPFRHHLLLVLLLLSLLLLLLLLRMSLQWPRFTVREPREQLRQQKHIPQRFLTRPTTTLASFQIRWLPQKALLVYRQVYPLLLRINHCLARLVRVFCHRCRLQMYLQPRNRLHI